MDASNWRPTQGPSGAVGDTSMDSDISMESGDWRAQLQAHSRQKIVNKITDTLKRHPPFSGDEGLQELKKIAVRFEEKIYTAATSQSDYLRKISLKMLTMETRSQNSMSDARQTNSAHDNIKPSDPGSQFMPQVSNQGQHLPIPVPSNHAQPGQQMMSQSMYSISSSRIQVQGSSGLSSALSLGNGLPQSTVANVVGQNPNMQNIQNMSGVQQNFEGNAMGLNSFASQRQIPGRQQLAPQQQQQQQQSQSSQYLYQQQLHQLAKQKLQQTNITPTMQSHIQQQQQQQQQNLLQPSHLQSSQQSGMPPAMMQTPSLSTCVQTQQPVPPQFGQLQQQGGVQQQPNLMSRDMQQRLPTFGGFQQQNVIDQQKLFQQQKPMPEASSTSLDSTAQTGNPNGGDWQEEMYQKIKAMKDLYLVDLNDMHQKILGKLQQHDSLPQQPKNEQIEKLRVFKNMLERSIQFLQIPKHCILANYKDKLGILASYEKQLDTLVNSYRRKYAPTQQQQQALPLHTHSMQQSLSQLTQMQSHDNQMNLQGSMGSLHQNYVPSMSGGSNAQQNMMNALQPSSNLDPGQNSSMNSLQRVSGGPLQQNTASGPQQGNINPMSLQPISSMLQHQHIKQQEQLLQSQQLMQFQHRQMQQQFMHKQQLMQQQQQQQQQSGQLQGNQLAQLQQKNDGGDIKPRQQMSLDIGHQQTSVAVLPSQSLASPLLAAEFANPDGNHGPVPSIGPANGKLYVVFPLLCGLIYLIFYACVC